MTKKYGKLPARPGAVSFRFATYFNTAKLPTPPAVFGHQALVSGWGMLANDSVGDCVWAGAAHETALWSAEAGSARVQFNDAAVLSDYSAVTGFNPADPSSDQGTDMQVAADYRRKTGIIDANNTRHLIDSYVALREKDVDELATAVYLLGAVGIGIEVPDYCEQQFDDNQPWDIKPNDEPQIVGGHYVVCVGRTYNGNFLVVTWGAVQEMTPKFYQTFNDESLAYVSIEALSLKGLSPEGFDEAALRADLAALNA